MTVASSSNRVDYTGNGSTTVFSFNFRILAATDLVVTKADTDGVETELVLSTDYTVSGVGSYSGGSITLASALTDGYALTIVRQVPITQETDLRNQGSFFAETHEDVFDRLTMVAQQLQEQIDRSAKLPVTNTEDADALVADIVLLADNISDLDTLVANLSDITTVANDLNEPVSEIETVSGAITNVNTVGNNIANVNTVAGNNANVTTVAGISANVTTVAGISGNVTTVAGISANVTSVAGNSTNINAVAGNATNINAVAGNSTNINAVNANKTNIDAVAGNATNINTVATNNANVTTVAGISGDVTTVAGISADVAAVENIAANVTTVAGIAANVTTVATNNANVSTVATNIASVNTVAGDIAAIITTANDLNEAVSEIEVVANNIAAVDAVGDDIANVNTVATNIASVNTAATNVADITNFADVYQGPKTSAPTLRNDSSALQAGDLYFNTVDDQMKVYTGSAWQAVGSTVNGTAARYRYIATAGQTTFTGVDSNSNTLGYDAGFIDVFLNGVRLDQSDYTATSGTSIVLASAAALNDELNIVAYGTFELADHYNKIDSDSRFLRKAGEDGVTVTGGNVGIGATDMSASGANAKLAIASGVINLDNGQSLAWGGGIGRPSINGNKSTSTIQVVADTFQFNSGYGSVATAYGCRAWVNFNGTGTVAIRASGNVSSITDNGTGDYTVNFTTAISDANYSAVVCQSSDVGFAPQVVAVNNKSAGGYANVTPTTSSFRFCTGRATDGNPVDALYALVSVFR
jgi:hypothetical protein